MCHRLQPLGSWDWGHCLGLLVHCPHIGTPSFMHCWTITFLGLRLCPSLGKNERLGCAPGPLSSQVLVATESRACGYPQINADNIAFPTPQHGSRQLSTPLYHCLPWIWGLSAYASVSLSIKWGNMKMKLNNINSNGIPEPWKPSAGGSSIAHHLPSQILPLATDP